MEFPDLHSRFQYVRSAQCRQMHYYLAALYACAHFFVRWVRLLRLPSARSAPNNSTQLTDFFFPHTPTDKHPLMVYHSAVALPLSVFFWLRLYLHTPVWVARAFWDALRAHDPAAPQMPFLVRFEGALFEHFVASTTAYWIAHTSLVHLSYQSAYWHALLADLSAPHTRLTLSVWDPASVEQWIASGWIESLKHCPPIPLSAQTMSQNSPPLIDQNAAANTRAKGRKAFFFTTLIGSTFLWRRVPHCPVPASKKGLPFGMGMAWALLPFTSWRREHPLLVQLALLKPLSALWTTNLLILGTAIASVVLGVLGSASAQIAAVNGFYTLTQWLVLLACTTSSVLILGFLNYHSMRLYRQQLLPLFDPSPTPTAPILAPQMPKNDYKAVGFDVLVQLESFLALHPTDVPSTMPTLNPSAIALLECHFDPQQSFDFSHLKTLLHHVYWSRKHSSACLSAPLLEPNDILEQGMAQFLEFYHLQAQCSQIATDTPTDAAALTVPARPQRRL